MKPTLFFIFVFAILSQSCSNYARVVTLRSTSQGMDSLKLVYSNDSFSIQYDFYGNEPNNSPSGRNMKMHITNKLSKPLILDWGQSSYIIGNQTHNYLAKPNQYANVPPQTSIDQTVYIGIPVNFRSIPMKFSYKHKIIPPAYSDGKDSFTILETDFTKANTPFSFRNYLALSYDASLSTRFYLDQYFWVPNVKDMKANDFHGVYGDSNDNIHYTDPFHATNCFFYVYNPNQ